MKYIKIIAIIIEIIVIVILAVMLSTNTNHAVDLAETNTIDTQAEETQEITPLQDSNVLYDLKSSVNKYLIYVQEQDTEVLATMIDEEYKRALDVTTSNLLSKIDTFEKAQIFTMRKVRMQQEENVIKYYIYGTVRDDLEADPEDVPEINTEEELKDYVYQMQEQGEQRAEEKDFYITLKYWKDTGTFTVMPFGFMGRDQLAIKQETTDISIEIEELLYTMNNVQIKVKIQNKTGQGMQLNQSVYMIGETGNSYETKMEETLQASQEKELVLQFNNNIDIPESLQFTINGQEITISL